MALWRRRNRDFARRRPIVGPTRGQGEPRRLNGVERTAKRTIGTGRPIGGAGARPARPPARRRHLLLPLPLPLSLALHGALIAALVLLVRHATMPRAHVQPGIAVVFKSTGLTKSAKHNQAPKSPRKGPTTQAEAPPPAAPSPPPKASKPQKAPKRLPAPPPTPPMPKPAPPKIASAPPPPPKPPKTVKPPPKPAPPKPKPKAPKVAAVKPPPPPPPKVKAPKLHLPKPPPMAKVQPKPAPQAQPQVRLNVPSVASVMPKVQLPQFETPPQAPPQPKQAQPKPSQRFTVMNNRSYGSSGAPSQPNPNFKHGMKLSLSQSELMHQGPSITFKGKAGADWQSAFSKWVNEHKYYPEGAADNNEQGSVTISMTVLPDGSVRDLHLVKGSGSPILNMAWLGLFQGVHVPKFPPGSKARKERVIATMHYILIH